ncbi:MAG: hypothetical protein Fur0018_08210 [Anaerolineales bacterium]
MTSVHFIFATLEIVSALAALVWIMRRDQVQMVIRRASILFTLSIAAWGSVVFLPDLSKLPLPGGAYTLLLLTGLAYLHLTLAALQQQGMRWYFALPGILAALGTGLLPGETARLAGLGLWVLFSAITVWQILRLRRSASPLHRNRSDAWLLSAAFAVSGGILATVQPQSAFTGAHLMLWLTLLLSMYISLQHRIPDMNLIWRQVLGNGVAILMSALIYTAILFLIRILRDNLPETSPWILYPTVGLTVALLMKPASDGLTQWSRRLFPLTSYDLTRTVREYSLSISNVLEINTLATIAIGLINEALEVQSGMIFLVERKPDGNGKPVFELRGVRGMGQTEPLPLELPVENVLALRLKDNPMPLTQYEIELHAQYQEIGEDVKAWMRKHNLDVYIPIYTKEEWIGLLALGQKRSGAPYQKEDLDLLRTLADQTAVALSNARLVEGLTRLNNDFRRAYNAMQKANLQLEKANQQLERLDRIKTDFISVTSHELRTPLTLISGYAQLLLEDAQQQDNAFHQQLTKGMLDGTTRMHAIISSMLDMASIDAQSMKLRIEPVMLAPLLGMVAKSYRPALKERNITLEVDNLQGIPTVDADPEALEKIFDHLLSNAIKYTPDGGTVKINARLLSAEKSPLREESVEIVVQDSGIGIDPKNLELIFTKFYQTGEVSLHSSGKTKFKGGGPGLGLAIVRGLVQALNGKVWAYSEGHDEEKCPGSRFHVVLPRKQQTI